MCMNQTYVADKDGVADSQMSLFRVESITNKMSSVFASYQLHMYLFPSS